MSNTHKRLGGILLTLMAIAVIGCSSDSSPSGPGGGTTKEFQSPTLTPGDSYEHVFSKAGTFPYFCSFHGTATTGMHATITVTAAGTPSKFQDNITGTTLLDFTVEVGDTIRWTNNSGMNHNVQSSN